MKKRKVLAMLLAFAMTFSLAACGSSGGNDDQANSDANTESGSDEDAIPDNEITGDPSAKDAFVVWAWNTDFTTLQDLLVEKYPDLKDRLVFVLRWFQLLSGQDRCFVRRSEQRTLS